MTDDIVRKLKAEFAEPITSERQVVYILVEIRKLLQKNDTINTFPALKLRCDWVVHPKLSWKSAEEIVRYFDDYEREYRKSSKSIKEFGLAKMLTFLDHTKFRAELIQACTDNGLTSDLFSIDDSWRSFILLYMEVITDCPLEANPTRTDFVTSVTAEAWPPHIAEEEFPGKVVIEWTWRVNDGGYPKTVVSFL